MVSARAHTPATSSLPACPRPPLRCRATPWSRLNPLALSLSPVPLLCLALSRRPSGARRHRRRSPWPLSPSRLPDVPQGSASSPSSSSPSHATPGALEHRHRHRHHPLPRRLPPVDSSSQKLPRVAELLPRSLVSFYTFPYARPLCFSLLASIPVMPELAVALPCCCRGHSCRRTLLSLPLYSPCSQESNACTISSPSAPQPQIRNPPCCRRRQTSSPVTFRPPRGLPSGPLDADKQELLPGAHSSPNHHP